MAVLQLSSLTKRYADTVAVEDLTLTVERGRIHGLLGPNGSGKTTALACALGLLRQSSGTAHVLGVPAREIRRTQGKVGAVFDSAALVSGLSVRENLEYARRLLGHSGGRDARAALRLAGVEELAKRRVGQLSLGQQKRVSIARALLGSPELLVFDEPLAALDTLGVRMLLALIRRLAEEGTTIIVSSHRLHEMQDLLTDASILSGGRLVASGSLAELCGGDETRVRMEVTPLSEARRVLDRMEGVTHDVLPAATGSTVRALLLRLAGPTPGQINHALVEAGCTVSAIVPLRRDLHTLFEELVVPNDLEATG